MGRFGICDLFLQLYPCNPLYIIKNGNGNPLYIEVLMGNDGKIIKLNGIFQQTMFDCRRVSCFVSRLLLLAGSDWRILMAGKSMRRWREVELPWPCGVNSE